MGGELEGLTAVLTGAAGGLGAAAARRFVEHGARVVVSDVDAGRAEAAAAALGGQGAPALGLGCDVTREADCEALVSAAERHFGRPIDVFVANAGLGWAGPLLEADVAEIARVIAVNVTGSILSARAALRSLVRSPQASLIFTASLQSVSARPQRSIYTTTKHALVGLTKSLAIEFGPAGVRVNAISPAATDTPFLRRQVARVGIAAADFDAAAARMATALPLGRLPTPEDFADAALFLASRRAAAISGLNLLLDGGAAAGFFDPAAHSR